MNVCVYLTSGTYRNLHFVWTSTLDEFTYMNVRAYLTSGTYRTSISYEITFAYVCTYLTSGIIGIPELARLKTRKFMFKFYKPLNVFNSSTYGEFTYINVCII